jgi:hypothetical protein
MLRIPDLETDTNVQSTWPVRSDQIQQRVNCCFSADVLAEVIRIQG